MNTEIDTGDTVFHEPTGELWAVACVIGDRLSWCGWPEGTATLAECHLVKKATAERRDVVLGDLAAVQGGDHRARYARERLRKAAESNRAEQQGQTT
jgi:hypothetical protein